MSASTSLAVSSPPVLTSGPGILLDGVAEILSSVENLIILAKNLAELHPKFTPDFREIENTLQECVRSPVQNGASDKNSTSLYETRFFDCSHFETLQKLHSAVEQLRKGFEAVEDKAAEKKKRKSPFGIIRANSGNLSGDDTSRNLVRTSARKRPISKGITSVSLIRSLLSVTKVLLEATMKSLASSKNAKLTLDAREVLAQRTLEEERQSNDVFTSTRIRTGQTSMSLTNFRNEASGTTSHHRVSASVDLNLLQKLRAPASSARHQVHRALRAPETCLWFLHLDEYQSWRSGDPSVLCVSGEAGIGKSVLTSAVIDDLSQSHSDSNSSTISCGFFYMGYDRVQSAYEVASSLIKQICEQLHRIPLPLKPFLVSLDSHTVPPFYKLLEALEDINSRISELGQKLFIILDGWDQPNLSEDPGFEELYQRIVAFPWHILVTYRPENRPKSLESLDERKEKEFKIRQDHTSEDVKTYIRAQLSVGSIQRMFPFNEGNISAFQDRGVDSIMKKSGGIFSRAAVFVQSVLEQRTLGEMEAILNRSETVDERYTGILDLVQRQPERTQTLANRALVWLVCLKKPVTKTAFCQVLVLPNSAPNIGLSDLRTANIESVITGTKDLITIDVGTSNIILAHHRLGRAIETFFTQNTEKTLGLPYPKGDYIFPDLSEKSLAIPETIFAKHKGTLAMATLRYLLLCNLPGFQKTCSSFETQMQDYPFLGYAAQYWAVHLSEYMEEDSTDRSAVNTSSHDIFSLFSSRHRVETIVQTAILAKKSTTWHDQDTFKEITDKLACLTDIQLLVAAIFWGSDMRLDELDELEAISRNCPEERQKHRAIFRVLTEFCVSQPLDGSFLRSSSDQATRKEMVSIYFDLGQHQQIGNEELWRGQPIDLILRYELEANPEQQIFLAILRKDHNASRALLERGADIGALDDDGRGLLHFAASVGDEKMIELLLDHGADINQVDNKGNNPLLEAIQHDQTRVISTILGAGVDLHTYNADSKSARDLAMERRNLKAVHLLEVQSFSRGSLDIQVR